MEADLFRDAIASLRRNKRKTVALTLYGLVTIILVGIRAQAYSEAPSVLVPIARGAAAGVYLNLALLLLPMMRLTLSRPWMRALRILLPFHKAMEAHAIAGTAVLVFSAVHVAAYVGLYLVAHDVYSAAAYPSAVGTGVALVVLCAALGWGVILRRTTRYEVFYFTHMLTIPIGVLAMVHAPWMAAIVGPPLGLYLADRLIRLFYMAEAAEVSLIATSGRDLDLVLTRPTGFAYRAGDYAFLCVPSISRLQWHPFSLINAPTHSGDLSFRIRRYGHWTQSLGDVSVGTKVYIDGPFSTPCRDLHGCQRAVVVAAGIGITPFVSFLNGLHAGGLQTERVHLYWLERDDPSFDRFYPLIEQLERSLGDGLHVKLVASTPSEQPRRLFVQGPIDFAEEFARLKATGDMDDATVFFCGLPGLSAALRVSTRAAGFHFRTESF